MLTSLTLLTLLVGSVFPLLIDAVGRWDVTNKAKALVLPALSLLAGVASSDLVATQAHHPFALKAALVTAAGTWVAGFFSHAALWSPTGISAWVERAGGIIGGTPLHTGRHAKP